MDKEIVPDSVIVETMVEPGSLIVVVIVRAGWMIVVGRSCVTVREFTIVVATVLER